MILRIAVYIERHKKAQGSAVEDFTQDERGMLAFFARRERSWLDALFSYGVYIVPSLIFAVYGVVKGDFLAETVAYGALLLTVIAALGYQRQQWAVLRSAARKCLARIAFLENAASRDHGADPEPSGP